MKILVSFSGGKDSLASLIWAIGKYGTKNLEAVFCDTGWEHELTYTHIQEIVESLQVKLVILKSKKYDGLVDLAVQKGRFPSTKARFCTEELKTKPMIDYVLSHTEHLTIIQGIRSDESFNRSKMKKQCSFFRYYTEPYGHDKANKPKFHTYRKKEVLAWRSEYADEIERPVFEWTAQQVIDYIIQNGFKPNPLYYMGFSRVGCFPCIMCRHQEIKQINEYSPEYAERLVNAEQLVKRSFFPPNYIPARFCSNVDKGKRYPSVGDVFKYVGGDLDQGKMFKEPDGDTRCMSFYGICE